MCSMKKMIFAAVMLLSGVTASAQINLGGILGAVTGNAVTDSTLTTNQGAGSLISNLTAIFSGDKQASTDNLVGTWEYSEPAIVFESENFLAKTGAKLAADKLEKKLQEYLTKYGIKPGDMTLTFNADGTFAERIAGRDLSGTWKVEDSKLLLTYAQVKTISITTQLDGGTLMFVTDATKLLDMFKAFGSKSSNSSIKTVTSLMKSISGMKAGLTLTRK